MHCASCASIIEKTLKKTEGVHSVEVNYGTETAKISYDETKTNSHTLSEKIKPLGYSLSVETAAEMGMLESEYPVGYDDASHSLHLGLGQSKAEKLAEIADLRAKVFSAIPLVLFSSFVMGWEIFAQYTLLPSPPLIWKEFFHHLLPLMATYMLFVVGKPYLVGLYRFLRYGSANMDSLVGLGTVTAYSYSFFVSAFEETLRPFLNVEHTYYDVTIIVIAFVAFGKYLEASAKLKTGDAIERLLNLQAKTAIVVRGGVETEIPVAQVVPGDLIVMKPAGRIPVDGILTEGSSHVDESMITGEPMPVKKIGGDSVAAGTLNTSGSFVFRATKVGSETMLAHIVKMVGEAQGSRAPIQNLADTISAVFVPTVLALACITFGIWIFVGTQYLGFSQALAYGLTSFVGILVIACPCALGLATPTAIIVGVGKGAKEGILVKDAATLENLHRVDTIVIDKTGTLTRGKPELVSLQNFSDMGDSEVISILASLENKSEHPIARAVIAYAKEKGISLLSVTNFEMLRGKGLTGIVDGVQYSAGSAQLARDLGASFGSFEKDTQEGRTPVILCVQGKVIAVAMVADAIKPGAEAAVQELHHLGITVVMLTGDDKRTAAHIARQLGIDEVVAEALPEDKLQAIKKLQDRGKIVAMVGDGVNDAPALAQAQVGIAMATGTDVAIASAGITLLQGDISKLVKTIHLSRLTMRGIKQNLFWAFFYNIVGIPLASGIFYPFFGWLLSPVFAGLAMAFSSVSVVANSLRLKTKRI